MADEDAQTAPASTGPAPIGGEPSGDAPRPPTRSGVAARSLGAILAALAICGGGYLFATGADRNAAPPRDAAAAAAARSDADAPRPDVATTAPSAPAPAPEPPIGPRPSEALAPPVPAPPPEKAAAADKRPADVRLRETVAGVARSLSCSDLRIETTGAVHTVKGVVATESEAGKVGTVVTALGLDPAPAFAITVEPQPFCAALVALGGALVGEEKDAPRIALNRADAIYPDGETLRATVTLPPKGGHLTVDYLDPAGPVVHMLPTPLRADESRPGGTAVTLGADPASAGPKDRYYTVAAPFGRAMAVAIVSDGPLFDQPRPEQEEAQAYVKALAAAIRRAREAGRKVRATTVFLETRER